MVPETQPAASGLVAVLVTVVWLGVEATAAASATVTKLRNMLVSKMC